jgi:nucleotide-binding universal stress UspA family protein
MTNADSLLVPLDGSTLSLRALAPALQLAHRLHARLDVVTWSFTEDVAQGWAARCDDALARLGTTLTTEALVTKDRSPGAAIASAARERHATVVMSSHGRSGLGHALLGSTAEEVLVHLSAPMWLVGPNVESWAPTGHVVTCVDGSAISESVLGPAKAWATSLDLPLHLVNVIEAGTPYPLTDDLLDGSYVISLAQRLGNGTTVDFEVLHGDPALAISDHATGADLVALATHGRTGVARTVMGSVAMRIVHHAPCPVVVVRSP